MDGLTWDDPAIIPSLPAALFRITTHNLNQNFANCPSRSHTNRKPPPSQAFHNQRMAELNRIGELQLKQYGSLVAPHASGCDRICRSA